MKYKLNYWVGYSSLQLALGYCYSRQALNENSRFYIVKKSKRYVSHSISDTAVHNCTFVGALWIFITIMLRHGWVWIPGISPTSCSPAEKLALRILFLCNKVRFYDDGMAGFVRDTYTWLHTLQQLPKARGHVTWNQAVASPLFKNAYKVDVSMLMTIESGLNNTLIAQKCIYSIFIEANAMNIDTLYTLFNEKASLPQHSFYFAHTDKKSVSQQFSEITQSNAEHSSYRIYNSNQYDMLESYLMTMLQNCERLSVYSGCTSTILILFLYAAHSGQLNKIRYYYSPDYSQLHPDKIPQSRSFYEYICQNYPDHVERIS